MSYVPQHNDEASTSKVGRINVWVNDVRVDVEKWWWNMSFDKNRLEFLLREWRWNEECW